MGWGFVLLGSAILQGLGEMDALPLLTWYISCIPGIFSAHPSLASLLPSTR